jgi:sugar phosphate isomerase/epimerase
MLTRREFIGAGIGAAVATQAFALPGDKMRYAMSGHQFRGLKPHPETGIKMAAQYGYHGLEPFQDDMPQYLTQPPEVFKKVMDASNLALCTIGSGGQYLDAARVKETIESNAARAKYIAHFGCRHLKVNLSQRVGPENLSAGNGKILARHLNEVGKRTMDHGVKFAFHPHAWTLVERQPELDMVMELTDPKFVFLVLDTGHATLGGIDPVKALRDYYPRIASIHLKDAEPQYSTAKGWKGPAPSEELHRQVNLYKLMGTGGVDFPVFFEELRRRGYDGWVTMDFDMPRPGAGTVEDHMNAHKKYLTETLKGQLRS